MLHNAVLSSMTVVLLLVAVATSLSSTQLGAAAVAGPTIYVSPSGNDLWSGLQATQGASINGTVPGPLRTLAAAVARARSLYGPKVSKTVRVARGTYVFSSSLVLNAQDNLTRFVAEDSTAGATVISGGVYIPKSAFRTLDSSTGLGARVPQQARSQVKQVDLTASPVGLTLAQLGALSTNVAGVELFFKGDALRLARWPNYPQWVLTGEATNYPDESLTFSYINATSWPSYKDVWVHGFFGYNWYDEHRAIASVNTQAKTITLASAVTYPFMTGMRFYYYNVIDALDTPGEYLIDYTNGRLYFYPPSAINSDSDAVLSMLDEPLITTIKASNVTFSGFTFEATQEHVILMEDGQGNVVQNCTIRNSGKNGVHITDGSNHLVMTSEIKNVGGAGVYMYAGDRITLTPANHMAFANHVHDFSRFTLCYNPGVYAAGVGMKIVNNKIHAAPHSGILLGLGNNQEIYFNEIYDVCRESSDAGAFYQGRDWTSQGTFISYNYFHDIRGTPGKGSEGVYAIYFDDEYSGSTVFGNIIVNAQRGLVMGGGRDNHVDNNVFLNISAYAYIGDARGLKGQSPQNNATMMQRLLAMPYKKAPWSTQYPTLVHILDNILADPYSPHQPLYNSYKHNVICNAQTWRYFTTAAEPFLTPVTSDNWWQLSSSTCQAAIFPKLASSGSLEMNAKAPFAGNITFSAIPWQRIGLEGASVSLPSSLPGLKYGRIVTPQVAVSAATPTPSGAGAMSGVLPNVVRIALDLLEGLTPS